MSGFAAIVTSDGAPVDEKLLHRMAEQLEFRGPDATQVRIAGSAGFCFTLLRTGPAPQAASQPATLNQQRWLLGDVRLDGRDDLRETLKGLGEDLPSSATDEELVLGAWRLRGPECGDILLGDYAFGIWEPAARRLDCVRDVVGARSFFYGQTGNAFCFSNTLEVLRLVPGLDCQFDEHFIGDFLLQGWCSDLERTAYTGIRRLKPGHLLEFRNGTIAFRRFAMLPMKEPLKYAHAGEYVEHFESLFGAAVRDRLPCGKVAIFMSGGLDSTSVAATAVHARRPAQENADFRAYTVDFRGLFDDPEPGFAARAAQHFGIPIEMVNAGDEVPFACWTDKTLRFPEPLNEPLQSRHVQMCRDVFAFARVALCGDGGDDILTGKTMPYARYLTRQGRFFELTNTLGAFLWKRRRLPTLGTGFRGRLRRWRGRDAHESALPAWLRPEFVSKLRLRDRLVELNRGYRHEHPFHPVGHALTSQGYWAGVLESEDAAWLGVPLERRTPFLDRRVLEFLLRVPPVPWCMEKELLREATRGSLPEEIRTRRKTPLLRSPFEAQLERLNWSPLPLPRPHPILNEFLDWTILEATLRGSPGSQLWDHLRAVSLNQWVKGVENEEAFR